MYDLGLSPTQVGIITAVTFGIVALLQPTFTALADRTQKHKQLLIVWYLTSGAIWCLLLIPQPEVGLKADRSDVSVPWNSGESHIYRISIKHTNESLVPSPVGYKYLEENVYVGHAICNVTDSSVYCSGTLYVAQAKDYFPNITAIVEFQQNEHNSLSSNAPKCVQISISISVKNKLNKALRSESGAVFRNNIYQEGKGVAIFPEVSNPESSGCLTKFKTSFLQNNTNFDLLFISAEQRFNTTFNHSDISEAIDVDNKRIGTNIKYVNFSCKFLKENHTVPYLDGNCSYIEEINVNIGKSTEFGTAFWVILTIYTLGYLFYTPALDSLTALKYIRYNSAYVNIGIALFGFHSGIALEYTPVIFDCARPWPSVAIYGFLHIIASLALCAHDSPRNVTISKTWKNIHKVLLYPPFMAMFMLVLIFGILEGVMKTYFFWHLRSLGASYLQLGVMLMVTYVPELCLTSFSLRLVHALGEPVTAHTALMTCAVMFVTLSYLENPWWYIPIALLRRMAVVTSLGAVMCYGSRLGPRLTKTLDSLAELLYIGIGETHDGERYGMDMLSLYWPFVRGIWRSTIDFPHKAQEIGSLGVFFEVSLKTV